MLPGERGGESSVECTCWREGGTGGYEIDATEVWEYMSQEKEEWRTGDEGGRVGGRVGGR